jgi:hypothetical protein
MALTLEKIQKLTNAGLVDYLNGDPDPWVTMARRTYQFLKIEFGGVDPLPDDVAPIILKVLRINPDLAAHLQEHHPPLTQQYWFEYFGDLILQRKWDQIRGANQNGG